tara:strand:+ start:503 stop:1633 length:1131 start_codon:yes stop_codon:yes gene_type:complete
VINITLAVSTPNNRGVHNVAKNLKKLGDINSCASLFIPKIRSKNLNFINRVIWELKNLNLKSKTGQDIYISVYSRLPINLIFNFRKLKFKKGIVVHDYIQYIVNIKSIFNLIRKYKFIELFKRIYHTLFFNLSVNKSDFFIFNSNATLNEFNKLSSKSINDEKNFLILHPLPSFEPYKVINESQKLTSYKFQNDVFKLLFITGRTISKRSEIIIPILRELALEENEKTFLVSIIGNHKLNIKNLPKNLVINMPKNSISEEELIVKYLEAQIFISTSNNEGFGIPLLDALNFNISSIATKIQSYLEIEEFYGDKNLTLLPVGSTSEAYKNAIRSLLYKNSKIDFHKKARIYHQKYYKIFCNSEQNFNHFLKNIMQAN